MHLWEREQEPCVEESRIKFEPMVVQTGVFLARTEQMHVNLLGLKQEIYTDLVSLWHVGWMWAVTRTNVRNMKENWGF